MMAMTTNNSIKVKARSFEVLIGVGNYFCGQMGGFPTAPLGLDGIQHTVSTAD
jgi:hypothetical protein